MAGRVRQLVEQGAVERLGRSEPLRGRDADGVECPVVRRFVAGLLDAVTMIGVGIALYLLFANPFIGILGG